MNSRHVRWSTPDSAKETAKAIMSQAAAGYDGDQHFQRTISVSGTDINGIVWTRLSEQGEGTRH